MGPVQDNFEKIFTAGKQTFVDAGIKFKKGCNSC
jgi:hypothetical protein